VSIIRGDVWLTNNQVNAYTGPGPLITDDHPLTEYYLLPGSAVGPTLLVKRLFLVVTGLLALLIIAYAADSALRRRPRAGAGSPPPLSCDHRRAQPPKAASSLDRCTARAACQEAARRHALHPAESYRRMAQPHRDDLQRDHRPHGTGPPRSPHLLGSAHQTAATIAAHTLQLTCLAEA
jgi:hypothetical protein